MTMRAWWGVAVGVLAAGCAQGTLSPNDVPAGRTREASPAVVQPDWTAPAEVVVREGSLSGRIGEVSALDAYAPTMRAWDGNDDSTTVELHGEGDGGAAMFALYASPSLGSADVSPGHRYFQSPGGVGFSNIIAEVVGCSGTRDGDWSYDEQPESLTIEVTDDDGDGDLEFAFEATFAAERTTTGVDEVVSARFELAAQ